MVGNFFEYKENFLGQTKYACEKFINIIIWMDGYLCYDEVVKISILI